MDEIDKQYPLMCCQCGIVLKCVKSPLMLKGENSGHISCPYCGTLLHVKIHPDINGNAMRCQKFQDFCKDMGLVMEEPNADQECQ